MQRVTCYAVIDTNVLVSAMLGRHSVPGEVVEESLQGRIIPLLNDAIISEYRDVLSREKFRFDRGAVAAMINDLIRRGIHVDAVAAEEFLPDPKDAVFYEVVMEARKQEGKSESYLVTGNIKHFPVKRYVVTPRQMLDILNSSD